MVRHDAANTGAAPTATGPAAAPTNAWSTDRTLGRPVRPTVLGDTVFVDGVGGLCGFTASGERRFAYDTNRSDLNPTSPVVVRDRCYTSRAGALFAVDAKTGAERWVFTPPGTTHRLAAPAAGGDAVHAVGQHPDRPPTLWAAERLDGAVRWKTELGGETAGPAVVADGRVYCATTEGGLYAVEADDGTVAWRRPGSPVVGPPAVGSGGVFVASASGVSAYRRDGSHRWTTRGVTAPAAASDGVVVSDGRVYAAAGDGAALVALDGDTGAERWRVAMDGDIRAPVVTGETVYAQDAAGGLRALRAADGSKRWSTRQSLRARSAIAVGDGGLFVGTEAGLLRYD